MENIFWYIVLAVYGIWSIRWGLRFVNGRWAALEQPKMRVVKVIISIVIGAVFYAAGKNSGTKRLEKGVLCLNERLIRMIHKISGLNYQKAAFQYRGFP